MQISNSIKSLTTERQILDMQTKFVKNSNNFKNIMKTTQTLQASKNKSDRYKDKKDLSASKMNEIAKTSNTINTVDISINDISSHLNDILIEDAEGKIHEEQLQYGIVHYLLEQEDPQIAEQYLHTFNQCIGTGTPPCSTEDAIKAALTSLNNKKMISLEVAERINGISFRAAQLDKNLTALFDNRGSSGDNTIATMPKDQACKNVEQLLKDISSGKIVVEPRSLKAPSNQVTSSSARNSGSGGFLWKPVSESDGKLVVLLPSQLTGNIRAAGIYSSLPASEETLIESGRFAGDHKNGGRAHFRFSQSGASYPNGSLVVAHLNNGNTIHFQIGDSSRRNT